MCPRPQVDLTYVAATAKAAKAAGVRHFSLVSSKGASAWLPASHALPLHPLLYLRTKGQAEAAVKQQARPSCRGCPTRYYFCLRWTTGTPSCAPSGRVARRTAAALLLSRSTGTAAA